MVLEENKVAEFKDVVKYNVGSAVIVTGSVLLTPQAKQPLEIHADSVILEGASSPDYPLQKRDILWNFCAASRISDRVPIRSVQYFAFGLRQRCDSPVFS